MIFVTSPYLPPIEKYMKYVEGIYDRNWLTNNGPLVKELTVRLEEKLGVQNLLLTSSGTMALQIAFKIKNLANKKVTTTPFTFQATYSALEWQGANVDFCDVNKSTWNLDSDLLEKQLASGHRPNCIVPVHTFGNPCNVEHLAKLQSQYGFDVIYDSAHAVTTKTDDGKSILEHGDINCFSLHATKLFHTVEGGGITFKEADELALAQKMINFGLDGEDAASPGINGKLSEFHAAMGLAILDDLSKIEEDRQQQKDLYLKLLESKVEFQQLPLDGKISPSYMPVLFNSETELLNTLSQFNDKGIYPRRYFHPAIHQMQCVKSQGKTWQLPIAEHISQRVLCLPLFFGQPKSQIEEICSFVK
ncbi:DegT/DnrJ/EryC1/StrS family aminotransferase [Pseudoalteromonas luteoviolacea]|uniref:Aminotransferase DegT n=1 Tax=Pseudoalteromonas luteoviolacea DSM 6061 TaxID=1365250 RepID=A0A161ZUG8_9GAMM|nr:DegT/DnrJ/EryC1/StrS family aminotransferase [Pseudoalteromonas luteoviolacea]KZN32986.1 hypothetical protein N475_20920 [Pseudoalteromonas luteoviolacea DSM 6061]MBE0385296.1 hypothetical protein [Pseudoalteromonas luteoviolacea DSM 6061]